MEYRLEKTNKLEGHGIKRRGDKPIGASVAKVPTPKPTDVKAAGGIFGDGSTDGPIIGTLIVVLDRAKNLPNRKSIGKQDPYCVVRLGKHAKRTEPDRRGGQTPRWDKELRFAVHDSGDYRTLKVVLFSEDKKTELIGETLISLDNILDAAGGGQSDGWHTCKCRDKYAGEIRVELTFWDERPREAAPLVVETRKEEVAVEHHKEPKKIELLGGPRLPPGGTEGGSLVFASKPKRRPLPPDPTTHLAIEDAPKAKDQQRSAPVQIPKTKEKEKHRHKDHHDRERHRDRDKHRDRERDRGHGHDSDRNRHRTRDERHYEQRDRARRHQEHDREYGYEDDVGRAHTQGYEDYPEYDDRPRERDDYPPVQSNYDHYREDQGGRSYQDQYHEQQQHSAGQTIQSRYTAGDAPLEPPQRQEFYDSQQQQHLPPQAEQHHQLHSHQGMLVLQGDAPPPPVPSRGARQSLPPAALPSLGYGSTAHNSGVLARREYQDQQPVEYSMNSAPQDYRQVSGQHMVEPVQQLRSQELVPYGSLAAPTVPSHDTGLDRLNPQQMAFNPQTQTFELVSSTMNQPLQMQQPPQQPLQPPVQLQQQVPQYQQAPPTQLLPQTQQAIQYQQQAPALPQASVSQSMQLVLRHNEEPSSPPPPPPQHQSLASAVNPPASSVALVSYMSGGAPPPPPPPSHRDRQVRMSLPATTVLQQQQPPPPPPPQLQQQQLQQQQQTTVQPLQSLPPQYQQQPLAQQVYQQPPLQPQQQQQPLVQQEMALYQNSAQAPAAPAHQELLAAQTTAPGQQISLPLSLQVGYKAYQPQVYQPASSQPTQPPAQPQQPQQALVLASQTYDAPPVPSHGQEFDRRARGHSEPPAYSSLEATNPPDNNNPYQNRVPSQNHEVSPVGQSDFQDMTQLQANQLTALARYGSGYDQSDNTSSYSNPSAYSNQSAPALPSHQSHYTSGVDEIPMMSSSPANAGALALYDSNSNVPPPLPRKIHATSQDRPVRTMDQYSAQQLPHQQHQQQQQQQQQQPQELPHHMSQREPSWNSATESKYDSRRRSSPFPPQKPPVTEHSNYHKPYVRDVTGRPSLESRRSLSPIPPPAPSEPSTQQYDPPNQRLVRAQTDNFQSMSSQHRQSASQNPRNSQYGYDQTRQPSWTSSDYSTSGHSAVSNDNSHYSQNDRGYESAITSAGNSWTPKYSEPPASHFRHNSDSSLPSYDKSMALDTSGRRTPPNNRAKSRARDGKNVSFDVDSESSYSTQVPIIKPRATSPNPASRSPSPAPYSNPPPVHPPVATRRTVPPERRMTVGIPFSPDSYDAINPVATFSTSPIAKSPVGGLSTSPAARSPGAIASSPSHYMTPKEEKAARKKEEKAARKAAKKRISTPGSQNRALHDDDILPEETHAPEPENRRNSFMGDDDDESSVAPFNLPPSKGPREPHSRRKAAETANKLQKVRPSKSLANLTSTSSSSREKSGRPRPLPGPPNAIMAPGHYYDDYGHDSYGRQSSSDNHRKVSPQKPPKIPLDRGDMSRDDWALSQELSGISIGSSSRRRTVGFR